MSQTSQWFNVCAKHHEFVRVLQKCQLREATNGELNAAKSQMKQARRAFRVYMRKTEPLFSDLVWHARGCDLTVKRPGADPYVVFSKRFTYENPL